MKAFRSAVCIILAIAMVFVFAACSGGDYGKGGSPDTSADPGTDAPEDTTADSGKTTEPVKEYEKDDLPDNLDFGGTKVVIMSPGRSDHVNDVTVEELTSDVVSDSIYNRKLYVEDRLNVEINNIKADSITGEMEKQTASGEDMYQIVVGETYDYSKYSFDGVLYDLNTVDNLNLSKPWWSDLFIKEASIGDKLYIATGSITLSILRNLIVMYYNKNLAENYRHNNPDLSDLEDLYSIVESGSWTLDRLKTICSEIYEDANGNTEKDEEDIFGLGLHGDSMDSIWSSFDLNILSPTEDGWFELDVNTDKLFGALEKVIDLIHNSKGVFKPEDTESTVSSLFASGRFLFAIDYLSKSESPDLRNMSDEYGVIPFPKLDEKQDSYYSYAYDDYFSYSIPKTNQNPEIAGAVMEAMASYSYRETVPAYLDTALKGKYMNDAQSRKMIDLIVDNFKLDTAWIYIFTIGAGYPSAYRSTIYENDTSFASKHQKKSNEVKKDLLGFKVKYAAVVDD